MNTSAKSFRLVVETWPAPTPLLPVRATQLGRTGSGPSLWCVFRPRTERPATVRTNVPRDRGIYVETVWQGAQECCPARPQAMKSASRKPYWFSLCPVAQTLFRRSVARPALARRLTWTR
jgi:hypothetical protein